MTDRPRALAVLIAVFLLGGVLGSAGTYMWLRNSPTFARRMDERFPPGRSQGRQRLTELLNLTQQQESRLSEIMTETRKQLTALDSEERPKVEAIWAETNRKFMAILNEEQQKRFEAFLKERRDRMPRGGRGMRPPPPER